MKFLKLIALLALVILAVGADAQNTSVLENTQNTIIADSEEYQRLKESGQLGTKITSGSIIIDPTDVIPPKKGDDYPSSSGESSSCYGYTPPNPAANPVLVNIDDQGFGPIALPFNFCFYGTNYNSCYINSNGNVTFGASYTTYSSTPFPTNTIPAMLAPFWGDVDTRGGGTCYYEVFSNAAIFHWEGVGYFNSMIDKSNTFQLIITDFTSPLVQPGNNVGFFYDNMDWTTGSASGGTNGFGGTAATVGVNEGNGTDYIQIGQYDGPGNTYDGPFNNADSVDWLDNKTFMFNVCNSTNLPPIVAGIDFCDTVRLCVGDTIPINVSFLAPEANQTTWANIDTTNASGFQVISNNSGTSSSTQVDGFFVADTSNIGTNILSFEVFDNGVPADTINLDYIIVVDSMPFLPVIIGDTTFCQGDTVILDGGAGFDTYTWNAPSIDTNQTFDVYLPGSYNLTATLGGCSFTTPLFDIVEFPVPAIQITGLTQVCDGDTNVLSATPGYSSYLWSSSINDTLDSLQITTQGNYSVTITDTNGCTNSDSFSVIDFSSTVIIKGDTTFCKNDTLLLYVGSGYDSLLWSTGEVTDSIYITTTTFVTDTITAYAELNTCAATDTHYVTQVIVPVPVITGDTAYCTGTNVTLNGDSAGTGYALNSFIWSPNVGVGDFVIATAGTYTVSAMQNGCRSDLSDPFTVSLIPLPVPQITGSLDFCLLDSSGTTLSTLNNYASYLWSPGGGTSPDTIVGAGNYTVSVVDANGCQGTSSSVTVTGHTLSNTFTGIVDFCADSSIIIKASQGYSYNWSTGSTYDSTTVTNGTYTVTLTDAFGCELEDQILITPNPLPSANFSINPADNGTTTAPVIFTDQSSGNITGWSWDFDVTNIGGASPYSANSQGPHSVNFLNQGMFDVGLTVTTDKGCVSGIRIEYLIVDQIIPSNVMTPNGDDNNDMLVFKNLEYYPTNHLVVFDRWGGKSYEVDNYKNTWDGGANPAGTYYYILDVEGFDTYKGTFSIFK